MKRVFYLAAAIASISIVGCKGGFKKTTNGIEYKIISDGKGPKVVSGNYLELRVNVTYKDATKDTILEDAKEIPTDVIQMNKQVPEPYFTMFSQLRNGDSMIMRTLTDTLFKKGANIPFAKKGEYIITTLKVVNVFTTDAQADSARKVNEAIGKAKRYDKNMQELKKMIGTQFASQMAIDDKILNDYMAKNHIVATKTELGDYVAITTPGTGENIDKNSIAVVNYTGKTLEDTVFDSNTDPAFKHVEPFEVDMSGFQVIPGWFDGLRYMKKGSKGLLLVPSSLAYGKQGNGPKLKPDANLVFNIEVVDIKTPEQLEAERKAMQDKMMQLRQHYTDSLQKARGTDTLKK